jgi:hypothetical protein
LECATDGVDRKIHLGQSKNKVIPSEPKAQISHDNTEIENDN